MDVGVIAFVVVVVVLAKADEEYAVGTIDELGRGCFKTEPVRER